MNRKSSLSKKRGYSHRVPPFLFLMHNDRAIYPPIEFLMERTSGYLHFELFEFSIFSEVFIDTVTGMPSREKTNTAKPVVTKSTGCNM